MKNLSSSLQRGMENGRTLTPWMSVIRIFLFVACIGLIATIARVGAGMFVPFAPPAITPDNIDLSPSRVPYYMARSTLRMFLTLPVSLVFSIIYGYIAAHSRRAEKIMVPMLDILQSVPVLGFLSVTVTGFIALFKGSLFGLEAASLFAIFTGQAWNMTFSFYQSLRSIPAELKDACHVYQLGRWQTFRRLELPSSMIPLIWNTMMSFGGGWFFVAASEAISVLNAQYVLPGIGSYVTFAIKAQDHAALLYAAIAMIVMILLTDQFFWRPLIAWSDRFKVELTESDSQPQSWVFDLLMDSGIPLRFHTFRRKIGSMLSRQVRFRFKPLKGFQEAKEGRSVVDRGYNLVLLLGVFALVFEGFRFILTTVTAGEIATTGFLAFFTFLRVFALVAISSLIWVPVGVLIGFKPKWARICQPVALFLASFPANFLFPFVTALFLRYSFPIDIGSAVLMSLGAQWYVLFNIIGGAQAIPSDLKEMAQSFRLKGWQLWKALILPGIFPYWVTGAVTAAGGAWNASIVAEIVTWGQTTLQAKGLGAYIASATEHGDWPRIALGVGTMSLFVVLLNRGFWSRLYKIASVKYAF